MIFRAETGTADDMMIAVDMYAVGHIPDPDHTKEVALARRAAEKRHPKAALYMVSYYVSGEGGVEKSTEKAFMWAIIADRLGQPDAGQFIPGFKSELGPTATARIEAEADAWLKVH
jgi:TPR repeat protein